MEVEKREKGKKKRRFGTVKTLNVERNVVKVESEVDSCPGGSPFCSSCFTEV